MKDNRNDAWTADIQVRVSMVVFAGSKREAMVKAGVQLGEEALGMLKVKLVDGEGRTDWFRVDEVQGVDWDSAVWAGYTGKYMMHGELRLSIEKDGRGRVAKPDEQQTAAYQLPRSAVSDCPHWSVPTVDGPVILRIESYEIDWRNAASEASEAWSKVG